MALSKLQKAVMALLAANRSETSYVAGGAALNKDWQRLSDDIDVFHDTDEEIGDHADKDIETLRAAGFRVDTVVNVYGCVEAEVRDAAETTLIQWMSETRTRFFPLVRDVDWGARLHQADLAVNKVLAASSRSKARDFADLVAIAGNYCPLGAVILAASGKPPHYSPVRMIDEIRRRGLSVPSSEFESIKGLEIGLTAQAIRDKLVQELDRAEAYIRSAPPLAVGLLALSEDGIPVEAQSLTEPGVTFRKPTDEHEIIASVSGD